MAEDTTDANMGAEAESTDSSSDVEYEPIVDDEGLVSTTEYRRVEPEEADSEEDTPDDAGQNTSEGLKSQDKDFHEHPRFKELIAEKNLLKQRLDAFEKAQTPPEPKSKPTYENIMEWEDDKLVDELANNPKGFLSKFAQQMWHEFQGQTRQMTQQQRQEMAHQRSMQTLENFFKDKEDGQQMLREGKIKQFIADNPGHNAISAYHALSGDAQTKKQIEEAVAKERSKLLKELKLKGNARSFSSTRGSTITNPSKDPELQNPGKFGGRNSVLVERMRKRMAAEG